MKPFIKHPEKAMGGSTENLRHRWAFKRKTLAEKKRKDRRNRRRSDKQDLLKDV